MVYNLRHSPQFHLLLLTPFPLQISDLLRNLTALPRSAAASQEMGSINVFVNYDGRWNDRNCYVDFKMMGILVPMETSYCGLLEIMYKEMQLKPSEHTIRIQYQVREHSPPIDILTDNSVLFYLELKKKDTVLTGFPLCITVENEPMTAMLGRSLGGSNHLPPVNHIREVERQMETMVEVETDEASGLRSRSVTNNGHDPSEEPMEVKMIKNDRHPRPIKKRRHAGGLNKHDPMHAIISDHCSEIMTKQVYKNKGVLKKIVTMFAIRNHFRYKVKKSNKTQLVLTCLDHNCSWYLRASKFRTTELFIVRKYKAKHTCSQDNIGGDYHHANFKVIVDCIKSKYMLSGETTYKPRDIIRDMENDYGISISYEKAWRARVCALDLKKGISDETYNDLPSYLHMLENKNPGSVTHLETDGNNCFKYLFVALAASIHGWSHCRSEIMVDGTFRKAKHSETFFIACGIDANDKMYPLAFGIGHSENDESWEWFFTKLKEVYGERDGLCIVSSQQNSIYKAVQKIYPNAAFRICMYHLLNNLKMEFRTHGKEITPLFIGAASSYVLEDFEYYMKQLDCLDVRIRTYLAEVGNEKWSRAFFNGQWYSIMTTNIFESMKFFDSKARELPVTSLVEWLRHLLQKWFWERRREAELTCTLFAAAVEKALYENEITSLSFSVARVDINLCQVYQGDVSFLVSLQDRTCSCRRFELDQIPCSHALAAISKGSLSAGTYCSHYFKKEKLLASYQEEVCPLGNPETWSVPNEVKSRVVLPPVLKCRPGRHKKECVISAEKGTAQLKCGRCKQYGHNRKTCTNPSTSDPQVSQTSSVQTLSENASDEIENLT